MNLDARSIAVWVVIGLIVGAIVDVVVPGSKGIVFYLLIGLLGGVIGGFLSARFNWRIRLGHALLDEGAAAVVGALILLLVIRLAF